MLENFCRDNVLQKYFNTKILQRTVAFQHCYYFVNGFRTARARAGMK